MCTEEVDKIELSSNDDKRLLAYETKYNLLTLIITQMKLKQNIIENDHIFLIIPTE